MCVSWHSHPLISIPGRPGRPVPVTRKVTPCPTAQVHPANKAAVPTVLLANPADVHVPGVAPTVHSHPLNHVTAVSAAETDLSHVALAKAVLASAKSGAEKANKAAQGRLDAESRALASSAGGSVEDARQSRTREVRPACL